MDFRIRGNNFYGVPLRYSAQHRLKNDNARSFLQPLIFSQKHVGVRTALSPSYLFHESIHIENFIRLEVRAQ